MIPTPTKTAMRPQRSWALALTGCLLLALGATIPVAASPGPAGPAAAPVAHASTTGHRAANAPTTPKVKLVHVKGLVTDVGAGSFTMTLKDGTKRTITWSGTTAFRFGGVAATSTAVVVGIRADARGTSTGPSTFMAVTVKLSLPHLDGVVTAVSGSTITIRMGKKRTGTIHVTGATTYAMPGVTTATLASILVGAKVKARGTLNPDGSLNAQAIRIHAAKVTKTAKQPN